MNRFYATMILCAGWAVSACAQELVKIPLVSTVLSNAAVVLSASSFHDTDPTCPIQYYTAFGSEVILPKATMLFSDRTSAQPLTIGKVACTLEYRAGNFLFGHGGKAQELVAEGLGFQSVPVAAETGVAQWLAFPRTYSYKGEGHLYSRSGSVQAGDLDGTAIRLYDDDLDGRYVLGKDGLSIGDRSGMGIFGPLGSLIPTTNGVYEVREVAGDGSSLTVTKYAGATGRLAMKPINNIECRLAFQSEDGKCSFGELVGSQGLVLPAGKYKFLYGFLYRTSAHHVVGMVLPSANLPLTVAKDADVAVMLGETTKHELPWGEGCLTLTYRQFLSLDVAGVEEAYNAGDYAKGQKLLDDIDAQYKAGPNLEASQELLEYFRQNLALENSAAGSALRDAEAKTLTALTDGKMDEARTLLPDVQKDLAAIPANLTKTWAYAAHKTRGLILANGAAGSAKPGLWLQYTKPEDPNQKLGTRVDNIDWLEPKGAGWGHRRTYEGMLVAPLAGEYELSLESVGAAVVTLDGKQIIDHPYHLPGEKSAMVALTEGPHTLRVDVQAYVYGYTHANKPHMIRLRWDPPGGRRAVIPAWAFQYRETNSAAAGAKRTGPNPE
jgi:hypothetical protein